MNSYIAYFDSLGFEYIFNHTNFEHQRLMAALSGETKRVATEVPQWSILRARANPQRFPEIWVFESDIPHEELNELSETDPQMLANAIRRCGHCVFKTPRQDSVIV